MLLRVVLLLLLLLLFVLALVLLLRALLLTKPVCGVLEKSTTRGGDTLRASACSDNHLGALVFGRHRSQRRWLFVHLRIWLNSGFAEADCAHLCI